MNNTFVINAKGMYGRSDRCSEEIPSIPKPWHSYDDVNCFVGWQLFKFPQQLMLPDKTFLILSTVGPGYGL